MVLQIPPGSGGAGGSFPFFSTSLWEALERLVPSLSGQSPPLTLSPREIPGMPSPAFWAQEAHVLLPPPPPELGVLPVPLTAVLVRKGSEWLVRARPSDSREKDVLWEWRFSGKEKPLPAPLPERSASDSFSALSGGHAPFRSETSPPTQGTDLFLGPFPAGPDIGPKPERCDLEIRWPKVSDTEPETGKAGRGGLFPFRLEIRYPDGETAVVGGVYDSKSRSLSLTSRMSTDRLADFWFSRQESLSSDLFSVFGIRFPGGADPEEGKHCENRSR